MKKVKFQMTWVILLLVLYVFFPFANSCSVLWSYSMEGITALSVSENGEYIAVGCQDGWYYIFDTWGNRTGSGHLPSAVFSLDIANTGEVLVGSATGYTFCTKEGFQGSSFRTGSVKSVSMSAEGTFSLVCSKGNIFINQGDSMIQQLQVTGDSPFGVMSSDSSLGCAASGRYLHLFVDGMFQEPLDVKEDIEHLFVSADGKIIVFSTEEEVGYIDMGKQKVHLIELGSSVTSMAVSLEGTALVSTVNRLIWLREGAVLHELDVQDQMQCLSLSEDGALAVTGKDSIVQIMTRGGAPVFTYDLEDHILASEISENVLVVCTNTSIHTFQFCKNIVKKDRFNPLSSRKSLPLTSPLEEVWSIPVAENSGFLTGDADGDGITEILLREESVLKLLDKNGTQKSARDFEGEVALLPLLDFDGDTLCEIPVVFEIEGLIFSIYDWERGFERTYDLESLRDQPLSEGMVSPFAVLDVDEDGAPEILADVYVGYTCKPRGVVSIDYTTGEIEWFYQMGPCVKPDVVADIDGDGAVDIVLGSMAPCNCPYDDHFSDCETYVTALSGMGEELWKVYLGEGFKRVSTYAADIDEYKGLEIVGVAYEASENWGRLFVLNCHGEYLYDFEVEYSVFPGAVVDIDADGYKEIVTLDSRGHVSVFTPDLTLKTETFIKDSISEVSHRWFNDLNGDGFCEIVVGVDNEVYVLDKNLDILWKKEFDSKIKITRVAHFNQCKNTLLVLSDRLYAFSYQDTEGSPCPLWEITERNLLEEATENVDFAESFFAAGEYRDSKTYFERALTVFSQLEDQEMIGYISKEMTELSDIIFKLNVETGLRALAACCAGLCVILGYSWITRKRWHRLVEGTLLLSLPVLLGLFQVYHAHEEYTLVFMRYFVPSFILASAVLLRKNILGFSRTVAALLGGHKDLLVLSITKSDGSYRVSVESIEEKFNPVKESREIVFPQETKKDIIKKVEYMTEVLSQYSTENVKRSLEYVEDTLEETGAVVYENFIPEEFSDILKAKFLLLEMEDTEIPWELMFSDDFFAVKYAISRRIVATDKVNIRQKRTYGRRALIISDPRENLPGAQTECNTVYNRLKGKMEVVLVEGHKADLQKLANLFGQGFDIIHYAGHVDNGLALSDGVMKPQNVKDYIVGTPVVFVNGCKSEELAKAFLLGGAMAYVGTIHPIHDVSAAEIAADFYDLCLQYQIGEALRRARVSHMNKDLVWASLIMYGDPTLKLL